MTGKTKKTSNTKNESSHEEVTPSETTLSTPVSNQERMDIYRQICDSIESGRQKSSEQYDQAVLTLASGFLALSLAFIKDIVPLTRIIALSIIIISWILLGLSVLLTLISFLLSHKAHEIQRKNLDDYFLRDMEEACDRKNTPAEWTEWLNYISGFCFIVGVILTIIFASINISNEQKVATQPKTAITETEK